MKKHEWPRYDPSRGYMLCEACWNYRHFSYGKDELGQKYRRSLCARDICDCPCTGKNRAKQVKFTGEGKTKISMDNPLQIKADS